MQQEIEKTKADLRCCCGGLLIYSGSQYICVDCGRSFCADCGGRIIYQGGCSVCLSCAASSCRD